MIGCSCKNESDLEIVKKFKPDVKYFKAELASLHFKTETRSIANVDTLYKQMIKNYNLPVSAEGCKDGIYTASSPADAFDYSHVTTIEIKNEKIVAVAYDEVLPSGKGKEHDPQYNEDFEVMGTTPKEFYPVYRQDLLDKQNIMQIDGISGASYTLYRFRYALMIALMKAKI